MFSKNKLVHKISLTLLVIAVWSITLSKGYNILVVSPHTVKSHVKLGDGIVRHLLKAGHQITYITPHVEDIHKNLTYVDVSITKTILDDKYFNLERLMKNQAKFDQRTVMEIGDKISTLTFRHDNVRKLMEDPKQHFDLVIAGWLFNERYCGFAALFNCPYVWLFPFEPNFMALRLIDEGTQPAYTANLELDLIPPYSFLERVRNLWSQITYEFNLYNHYDDMDREAYETVFQPIIMKKYGYKVAYDELKFNASLIFSYSHSSLGHAIKAPANLIPVGGYHVDDKIAPLSTDLKAIMDNSKYGVIYFSMGSNLRSKDFPKQVLEDLIKMFANLKQTVIWKFEEDLLDRPKNVHILKWAPQQSILAHPNCILFITHGGLLSTTEAVHFGVPVIGIPVYFDQFSNMNRAASKGFGKKITLSFNFAQDLKVTIDEMLADPRYASKAKEVSYIYHHRPVPPGEELVHWVEHVVATRGAPHLRSPALQMPWYQKTYLDLAAIVTLFVIGIYFLLKSLWKRRKCKLQSKKLV